jgi:hypothetical protein
MADAISGGILFDECRPICRLGTTDFSMIEILFIYQLARNPIGWMTRRFWCRSLFRATRGKRGCPESTNS